MCIKEGMMHELKFRAWDYDSNKMLYFYDIFNTHPWTETSTFPQYESLPKDHKLSPIQQFTGMYDCTGKEIYTGDIIDWGGVILTVVFIDAAFYLQNKTSEVILSYPEFKDMKIIGNVYEDKKSNFNYKVD